MTPRFIGLSVLTHRSTFEWLQDLEDAAPDITREMEALARAGGGGRYKGGTGEMSTVYDATQGWGTMRLRYMGRCVCRYETDSQRVWKLGLHCLITSSS